TVIRAPIPEQSEASADQSHANHLAGLRAVASLEMFKGVLAIIGGIGLVTLLHKDIGDVAESIVEALHLNPAHRIAQAFIHMADRVDDSRIVAMACVAFAYSIIRFAEAYGLWHARAWAEWFAIISGAAYLPWEIIEVAKHAHHVVRWTVLIVNVLVVLYMIYVRCDSLKGRNRAQVTGNREHRFIE
ncbi:MAG TPA: DUF2127 domain-containing protein, partial [Terriglobales bacterium]|nr:DUF2127 domain-containing protein [Terriglobales bacterium]